MSTSLEDPLYPDGMTLLLVALLLAGLVLFCWLLYDAWRRGRPALPPPQGRIIDGYVHVLGEREPIYLGEAREDAEARLFARRPDLRTAAQTFGSARTKGPRSPYDVPPRPPGEVLALLILLALPVSLLPACVSPLDAARRDFSAALKVAESAQVRLKAYDARHQLELVRAAPDRVRAAAALAAYRVRRATALEQAAHTEAVMDSAADVLLLGEGPAPARAAADARASALALRAAVDALMGGR